MDFLNIYFNASDLPWPCQWLTQWTTIKNFISFIYLCFFFYQLFYILIHWMTTIENLFINSSFPCWFRHLLQRSWPTVTLSMIHSDNNREFLFYLFFFLISCFTFWITIEIFFYSLNGQLRIFFFFFFWFTKWTTIENNFFSYQLFYILIHWMDKNQKTRTISSVSVVLHFVFYCTITEGKYMFVCESKSK